MTFADYSPLQVVASSLRRTEVFTARTVCMSPPPHHSATRSAAVTAAGLVTVRLRDPSYRLGKPKKTKPLTSFSSSLTSVNARGQKELSRHLPDLGRGERRCLLFGA